jgi:glycerophosphoryl diester phosphodiesterase
MHPRPLLDALDQGFCSIEADIWLVDGQLLVAHDLKYTKPGRTLEALYLNPIQERVRQNSGRLYKDGPPCVLLIDIKSDSNSTYAVLSQTLKNYTNILTAFTPTNTRTNAITVILSGNRPTTLKLSDPIRYASMDGVLSALDENPSVHLTPQVSASWASNFKWRGVGPLPEDQSQKLRDYVRRAHEQGRHLRFWAIPDTEAGWREMKEAGVDWINTDKLPDLARFINGTNQP